MNRESRKIKPAQAGGGELRARRDRIQDLKSENKALRENLRMIDDMRGRLGSLTERMSMMAQISQELNVLDLDILAKIAVEKMSALIGARYCSFFLYDPQEDQLVLKEHNYTHSIARQVVIRQYARTLMGLALSQKRTIHIPDLGDEDHLPANLVRTFADRFARRSFLSVPLIAGGTILGVLNFSDKKDGTSFSEMDDIPVVEQLKSILSVSLYNCRLFQDIKNQARTDALTQLLTVRVFRESLENEIHRAIRYTRPLSLLTIDLDQFKGINDTHGHPAGDEVLKRIGAAILGCIRRGDIAARMGGDEFAILLPETGSSGAATLASRIVTLIRSQQIPVRNTSLSVTASIGIASFDPKMSAADFLHQADQALYSAKQKGKNCFDTAQAI